MFSLTDSNRTRFGALSSSRRGRGPGLADVYDTCHTYLKSIDLTKTGLAVAVVDELATIPLDLWAREHGYEKLQINLLGT
jgi:hypothetical protein